MFILLITYRFPFYWCCFLLELMACARVWGCDSVCIITQAGDFFRSRGKLFLGSASMFIYVWVWSKYIYSYMLIRGTFCVQPGNGCVCVAFGQILEVPGAKQVLQFGDKWCKVCYKWRHMGIINNSDCCSMMRRGPFVTVCSHTHVIKFFNMCKSFSDDDWWLICSFSTEIYLPLIQR